MKLNGSLKVIYMAACELVRSSEGFTKAYDAIRLLCGGDATKFKERVSEPLREHWDELHPPPEPIKDRKTAPKRQAMEHDAAVAKHNRARHAFIQGISFLKARAGLKRAAPSKVRTKAEPTERVSRRDQAEIVLPHMGETQNERIRAVRMVVTAMAGALGCTPQEVIVLIVNAYK